MTEVHRRPRRYDLPSLLVYLPLQAALLPLGIVGATRARLRQLRVSRRLGVSQTAVEVLNVRCAMHLCGLREDAAAIRLARHLPNASLSGLEMTLLPLRLTQRVRGQRFPFPGVVDEGHERIIDLITARTRHFDRMLKRLLPDVAQLVLLGAGFDTRAFGKRDAHGLSVYEVDRPEMQALKRQALREAGISTAQVTFVPVDFARESLFEQLISAGFDLSGPALFLWEGVTLYLDADAVMSTLRDIATHAAPGSAVLADFYGERLLRFGSVAPARQLLQLTGESFAFGLPFKTPRRELGSLARATGLTLGEVQVLGERSVFGAFAAVAEMRRS